MACCIKPQAHTQYTQHAETSCRQAHHPLHDKIALLIEVVFGTANSMVVVVVCMIKVVLKCA